MLNTSDCALKNEWNETWIVPETWFDPKSECKVQLLIFFILILFINKTIYFQKLLLKFLKSVILCYKQHLLSIHYHMFEWLIIWTNPFTTGSIINYVISKSFDSTIMFNTRPNNIVFMFLFLIPTLSTLKDFTSASGRSTRQIKHIAVDVGQRENDQSEGVSNDCRNSNNIGKSQGRELTKPIITRQPAPKLYG